MAQGGVKNSRSNENSEVQWLKRLVEKHPALQGVPEEIKAKPVEVPAENFVPPGNKKRRKLWISKGMFVHHTRWDEPPMRLEEIVRCCGN